MTKIFFARVATTLLLTGCATQPHSEAEPTGAIVESQPPPAEKAQPAVEPAVELAVDPTEAIARQSRTGQICEDAARRRYHGGDKEGGWRTLVACSQRADFFDMRPLTRPPWIEELRRRGIEGLILAARVAARNPDTVKVDLGLLAEGGVAIFTLDHAEKAPAKLVNHYVLIRALLKGSADDRHLVALECSRRQRRESHLVGGSLFINRSADKSWIWAPNGRELTVTGAPAECTIDGSKPEMILLKLHALGVPSDAIDPEAEDEAVSVPMVVGRASIITCFPDLAAELGEASPPGFR